MKAKLSLILMVILLISFNSCTVQKRLYNKGYHVEWRYSIKQKKVNISSATNSLDLNSEEEVDNEINENTLFQLEKKITITENNISFDNEVEELIVEKEIKPSQNIEKEKWSRSELTLLKNKVNKEVKNDETEYKKVKAKDWTILAWVNFISAVLIAIFLVSISLQFLLPLFIFLIMAFVANDNNKKVWKHNDVKAQNPKNFSIVKIFTVFSFLITGAIYLIVLAPFTQIIFIFILTILFLIVLLKNSKKYEHPMYNDRKEDNVITEKPKTEKPIKETPKKEPKPKKEMIHNKTLFWFYMLLLALVTAAIIINGGEF